jgi:amino acid permease
MASTQNHRTADGGNTFELNALEANGQATKITRNSSVNREVNNNASDRQSEQVLSENEEQARRFRPRHIQMMALGT